MDAIELLKKDHRNKLFKRFQQARMSEKKRKVVSEIIQELSVHAAIEEEIFYPSVREALPERDPLVQEACTSIRRPRRSWRTSTGCRPRTHNSTPRSSSSSRTCNTTSRRRRTS